MLEDQLILVVGFENHRVLVEALDATGQFHSTHQINRGHRFVPAGVVEKNILNILHRFFHGVISKGSTVDARSGRLLL
jgi:hypothetical protein